MGIKIVPALGLTRAKLERARGKEWNRLLFYLTEHYGTVYRARSNSLSDTHCFWLFPVSETIVWVKPVNLVFHLF